MKQKKIIRSVHKWLGLSIALYLMFQSVSGVLLVYRNDIETYASRSIHGSMFSATPAPLDKVIENLELRYAGYAFDRIYFPESPGEPYLAVIKPSVGAPKEVVEISQLTGQVHGSNWATDLLHLVFELHHQLALGGLGSYIVGLLGLLLVISTVLGFWQWWPGWRRVRNALKIRRVSTEVRDLFDLHRAAGAALCVVITLSAVSGFALAYGGPLRSIFDVGAVTPTRISEPGDREVMSADDLLDVAQAAIPDARVRDIRFSQPGNRLTTVVFFRDTVAGAGPLHRVWLDPYTGAVRGVVDSRKPGVGNSLLDWMYPIHTEMGLAGVGKIILTIGGLGLLLLSVTGPMLWWKKRRRRARNL